jgi:hypothetical protein
MINKRYIQVHRSLLFRLILDAGFGTTFKVTIEAKGAPRLDPDLFSHNQGGGQEGGKQEGVPYDIHVKCKLEGWRDENFDPVSGINSVIRPLQRNEHYHFISQMNQSDCIPSLLPSGIKGEHGHQARNLLITPPHSQWKQGVFTITNLSWQTDQRCPRTLACSFALRTEHFPSSSWVVEVSLI